MSLLPEIPGEKEAIERQEFIRAAAFLDEWPERICGLPVRPLTCEHLIRLTLARNAFIVGGFPSPREVRDALWVMSVHYAPRNRWRRLLFQLRMFRMNYAHAIAACDAHFSEAFQDAPGGSGLDRQSYYDRAAGIVNFFAIEYGWAEDAILRIPLKRLFQYQKAWRQRNDPKCALFNPSDAVRSRWLRELNEKRKN